MRIASDEIRRAISTDYAALDVSKQATVLAVLGDRLSLLARDTYNQSGGVADSDRLRKFNEAENRILAQLARILSRKTQRYPDDIFANIVIDQLIGLDISLDEFSKLIKFA